VAESVTFSVEGAPPRDGDPGASDERRRLRRTARQALAAAGAPPFADPVAVTITAASADLAATAAAIVRALEGVAYLHRSQVAACQSRRPPSPPGAAGPGAASPGYTVTVRRLAAPDGPARHFTASAFVVHRGRVLLLLHRDKGLWLPPGGHVRPDESPLETVVREVREECGLEVDVGAPATLARGTVALPRPEALLELEVAPGHHHLDLVWFARPAANADPDRLVPGEEAAQLGWFTADQLPSLGPSLPPDVADLARRALGVAGA
jgi:8-oxo-dGTP pyrophosphatase MutT (NUDIX family)